MIVNYDELHKIVAPIIAALPDVLFLLEQINAAIDLMTALLHRYHKEGSETALILILCEG